jgi:hypothetical protein
MPAHRFYAVRLVILRRPLLSQVDEQTDEQDPLSWPHRDHRWLQ